MTINKSFFLFCGLVIVMSGSPVQAQNLNGAAGGSKEPVEISAGKTLEWHQKDKQYVAVGDVEAKQGDFSVMSDTLTADYRDDGKGGSVDIWQLTAEQHVIIKNAESTATGEKGVYNVETGIAVLTASEDNKATLTKGTDKLTADVITAYFGTDAAGKQILKTATAEGHVVITTPEETLSGNKGVYNTEKNTAEVTGNVKIVRGPNVLEGARAEMNLTTNISKMYGGQQSGQRVKGIFFPGSSKH